MSVLVALLGTAAVVAVQTRANGRFNQAKSELPAANERLAKMSADVKSTNDQEK